MWSEPQITITSLQIPHHKAEMLKVHRTFLKSLVNKRELSVRNSEVIMVTSQLKILRRKIESLMPFFF